MNMNINILWMLWGIRYMYNMYVLRNNIRAGITLFLKLVSQTFLWFAFLFHKNMYYSRVQGRDCIISEISGWNICQGDAWLIKNEEAVKVIFFVCSLLWQSTSIFIIIKWGYMFVYCAGWLKHLNTNILFMLWHFVHLSFCYLKQNLEDLLDGMFP
jgi:hypothetical protein